MHEASVIYGVESMPKAPEQIAAEEVAKREHLYVLTHLKNLISCGDDRALEQLVIQLFGGVAFITYYRTIVMEVVEPGSTSSLSFDKEIKADVKEMQELGINAAVHSDDQTEHGTDFQIDIKDGGLGCAYISLRQQISQKIFDEGDDLIASLAIRQPELFQTPEDYEIARKIIEAHGRMALNNNFFKAGGRQVALSATEEGAQAVVVKGQHDPDAVGIINTVINSTLDTTQAIAEDLPAYNHDQWVADAVNELRGEQNKRLHSIAAAIDTEGVFRALGVKVIGVRKED